ncbi:YjbH domain-containing protein [Alishewanella sp. BS5-314]|uniref:YjbH domain-containing protein n=1 Tax=Alishewanella sp. BS5-314 TaxID=2755587 RepID=UPI0021C4CBA9|nr:YjbH domain-containing protein [Alishewanella sp. BS5-314]
MSATVNAEQRWQLPPAGVSQSAHGGVGLIQVPTARMASEGNLSINYSDNEEYRFWTVSTQLFPWLEATVRYTDVRTRLYSNDPGFSGDQTLKDKGIDAKFRLRQESKWLPEVAVGLRDLGGTGFFESEFAVLSKKFGDFDLHLGLGWGYLGNAANITNPFCSLAESFCLRAADVGQGGTVKYDNFFKGSASVYGGIEYQTSWQPLRLKLEYEGNNYLDDAAGALAQDSRWNLGAVYHWRDFDFSLNYQRGNTLGFGVSYALNLHNAAGYKVKPPLRDVPAEPKVAQFDQVQREQLIYDLLYQAGFLVKSSALADGVLTVYGNQIAYRDHEEALERIGRILAAELPADITTYKIVNLNGNIPMLESVIDASEFKAVARNERLGAPFTSTYVRQDVSAQSLADFKPLVTKGFYTNMELFWIQTFGSPEEFYMYQGGVILGAGYSFNPNWALHASSKVTLIENFDKFNFTVDAFDTGLPRVRTYIREYVTRSKITLDTLYGNWQERLAPNLYGQLYAGYLEAMYGGVGGEVMYRPVDSNWAVGFDLNYVRQRSYENDFSFFDYKVLTGHANIYWKPDFLPDTQLTFNVGRFLAKDLGVNVDFAKRFNSGIVMGAYAAITDVSSEQYGEGSFTKGFYISIPFDLFSITPATGRGKLPWIPISRDGGQMLNRPSMLYNMTEQRSPFFD